MLTSSQMRIFVNKLLAFMGSCDGGEYVRMLNSADEVCQLRGEVIRLRRENARLTTLLLSSNAAEAPRDFYKISTLSKSALL